MIEIYTELANLYDRSQLYPNQRTMVKFKLNKQLDIDMVSQFLGTQVGSVDFGNQRNLWKGIRNI